MLSRSALAHPVLHRELSAIGRRSVERIGPVEAWMTASPEPIGFAELDVAAMTPIRPGHVWGRKLACAWLRLRAEVPPGAEDAVLLVRNGGEGLVHTARGEILDAVTTVWAPGDLPQATGAWRAIELPPVRDGAVEVLIDCGWNGLRMVDIGAAVYRGAMLARRIPETTAYFYDYLALLLQAEAATTLPPVAPVGEDRAASLARGKPWRIERPRRRGGRRAGSDDAASVAPAEGAVPAAAPVEGAAPAAPVWGEDIPADRLVADLRASFRLFRARGPAAARALLAPHLEGPGRGEVVLDAVGHGHLDLAWMWPIRETRRKAARTYTNALGNLERYPDHVYGTSQPQQLAWTRADHPELYARVREQILAGRIEMQGGFWVECDCNLSGGEALIRQAIHGRAFVEQEFGVPTPVCWLPDAFGFPASLPQILQGCHMPYFLTIKLAWNAVNDFPYHTFTWRGIDGSGVVVHMPPEGDYNSQVGARNLLRAVRRYREPETGIALQVFGSGDGGGGPNESHLELLARESDAVRMPLVRPGRAADFFARLAERPIRHEHTGELYLETHQGTYTAHARGKALNARCERALHDLEALVVLDEASGSGPAGRVSDDGAGRGAAGRGLAPADVGPFLDRAWKTLLLHQFHDILPGSSITRVNREAVDAWRALHRELTEEIRARLAGPDVGVRTDDPPAARDVDPGPAELANPGQVATLRPAAPGPALALANFTSFPRAGYRKHAGSWYRAEAAPWSAAPAARTRGPFPDLAARAHMLSNGRMTLRFSSDGHILSARDASGHELAAEGLGELVLFTDWPQVPFNAWDIDRGYRRKPRLRLRARAVRTYLDGPLAVRESLYRTPGVVLRQRVVLEEGSDLVLFDTLVDWHATCRMLRAEFRPADYGSQALCGIQFGHLARPTTERDPAEAAQFEVCAHGWVATETDRTGRGADVDGAGRGTDVGGARRGFALLSDSRYGYRVKDGLVSSNLLRAPLFPDPHVDRGRHRLRYAFMPWSDGDLLPVLAASAHLNHPFAPAGRTFSSLAASSNPGVVVETVKPGERGGVVLRLYEALGRAATTSLTTALPHGAVHECDMLENPLREVDLDHLELGPFQILTLHLDAEGDR